MSWSRLLAAFGTYRAFVSLQGRYFPLRGDPRDQRLDCKVPVISLTICCSVAVGLMAAGGDTKHS
jgi:hypothetical protein